MGLVDFFTMLTNWMNTVNPFLALFFYVIGWVLVYFSFGEYAVEQGKPIPKNNLLVYATLWPVGLLVVIWGAVFLLVIRLARNILAKGIE